MPKLPNLDNMRFWPLLGLIVVVDIVLTFLYTVIVPGISASSWADVQSTSAFLFAIGSVVPVFLDAGRGFGLSGKMGGSRADQHEALSHERSLREKGMKYPFLMALSTFKIALLSLILSVM